MMKVLKLLLLFSWIFIQSTSVFAESQFLQQNLPSLNKTISEAGNTPCLKCSDESKDEVTTIALSKANPSRIEVSVISLSKAKEVFKQLAENEEIPHKFVFEGCFARAHAMVQQMDEMGLTSVKAYVEGDLRVDGGKNGPIRWSYHVAPMVMVKTPKGNVPYVFDPSLFKTPVPFEEWKNLMLKDKKSKYTGEYFTTRFNYHPNSRNEKFVDYNEEDLEHARDMNKTFTQMLYMLELDEKEEAKNKSKSKK